MLALGHQRREGREGGIGEAHAEDGQIRPTQEERLRLLQACACGKDIVRLIQFSDAIFRIDCDKQFIQPGTQGSRVECGFDGDLVAKRQSGDLAAGKRVECLLFNAPPGEFYYKGPCRPFPGVHHNGADAHSHTPLDLQRRLDTYPRGIEHEVRPARSQQGKRAAHCVVLLIQLGNPIIRIHDDEQFVVARF